MKINQHAAKDSSRGIKSKTHFIIFLLILVLGFGLRTYNLANIPAGFFADEASIGYNAFSILTTGFDEHGAHLPFFFRAFGEYKSPIQTYSTVPLVALFGLNEMSVRLVSVTYGILSIIAIYLLTKELFIHDKHRQQLALLSALFLAISPWHIHFSRVSLEGLMAFVFFTTIGLYFFLKAQLKPKFLYLSLTSFALAMYCYFPARIFIPLFGLGLFAIYFRFFLSHKKESILSFILLLILLAPFIQNLLSPVGLARWQQVNIFSNPPQKQTITTHILSNYFRHFSADFLFLKGDIDMPGQFISRHSIRGIGELYLLQLPLIVFGAIMLFKKKSKAFFALLLWLVLYPMGSIFTIDESPQATRSIIGTLPFQILSAAGVVYLLRITLGFKKYFQLAFISTSSIVLIISFANFLSNYFISYPNYSSDFWGWQY